MKEEIKNEFKRNYVDWCGKLKTKQFEAVKQHVLNKIKEVESHIINDDFSKVLGMLAFSPAGDGYGCDNYFVNFKYDNNDNTHLDLSDMIDLLKNLSK